MKPKRTFPTIVIATTLPTASAQTAQSGQRTPTLTETLQALNDSLSILNSYIQTQQYLFAAINGTSGITILAPSNDAMAGLLGGSGGGGGGEAVTMDDLNNSDPQLVEAFWNYHVLRGVWWTSNLTAGTGGSAVAAAAKRRRSKRDDSEGGDGSGIDGNSLFIPTLLAPDITPYANVSGGQRVIARSSFPSDGGGGGGGGGEPVVTFYSGISGSGGSQQITKSTITQANFNFSGGTIHIIDHVLSLPSRLNDTLASFGPFASSTNQDDEISSASSLLSLTASVGALSRANLTDVFNAKQDITIFIPSNDAWNAVGSVVSDMGEDELADIMGYHVLKGQKGKVFYSDLLEQNDHSDGDSGGSDGEDEFEKNYETVEGGTVKVRVVDGSTSPEGGIKAAAAAAAADDDDTNGSGKQVFVNGARVVKSDVLVENGVVHVVDGVLNPNNSTATPIPTASTEPVAWEGATTTNSVPFTLLFPL